MSIVNLKDNPAPSPPPGPPPGPPPPPSICTSQRARNANMSEAIGVSLLDLTGLGSLFDIETPMDKLQKEIQKVKDKTQGIINKSSSIFASQQVSIDEEILTDINAVNDSLRSYIAIQDEILSEKSTKNLIYIIGSFFLLLVTIVFLLISNAFKR